jgi:hypothetical protein
MKSASTDTVAVTFGGKPTADDRRIVRLAERLIAAAAVMQRFRAVERSIHRAVTVWERQNGRNGATVAALDGLGALRDFATMTAGKGGSR